MKRVAFVLLALLVVAIPARACNYGVASVAYASYQVAPVATYAAIIVPQVSYVQVAAVDPCGAQAAVLPAYASGGYGGGFNSFAVGGYGGGFNSFAVGGYGGYNSFAFNRGFIRHRALGASVVAPRRTVVRSRTVIRSR